MDNRELDRLIAQAVFNWVPLSGPQPNTLCRSVPPEDQEWWAIPGVDGLSCGVCCDYPPHYTTDIYEAWKVVGKTRLFSEFYLTEGGKGWLVVAPADSSSLPIANELTAPLAICKAVFVLYARGRSFPLNE